MANSDQMSCKISANNVYGTVRLISNGKLIVLDFHTDMIFTSYV